MTIANKVNKTVISVAIACNTNTCRRLLSTGTIPGAVGGSEAALPAAPAERERSG